ncbi:hypothetical protein [Polynucleobacter sp. HIN5]|uniref:hypothetical protein n=1 Tax=Polynucleobacter sp. HIN5 TaxID=3047864 RepID=UPI0025737216|nr:hypothetical protein [Polynucleobacter sp. HIN5]BEI33214.1 hypothetical protein PHIN5_05820 [Polynucleobacter sp. HIN5]
MEQHRYPRHFQYKHPTFGTKGKPKSKSSWEGTVYYWWWEYLRRNTDYLKCCESGGKGNLANLYKDFGDVRGDSFKNWWTKDGRGVNLFADPQAEYSIRVMEKGQSAIDPAEAFTISIPLYLPKKLILRRFKELLDERHKGKRGHQLAKRSKARYQVKGQPNIPAIKQALEVYDFKKANPKMKLWEIGNAIPKLQMGNKIKAGDTESEIADKKNVLAATVSRYLRRAEVSIQNTTLGKFP